MIKKILGSSLVLGGVAFGALAAISAQAAELNLVNNGDGTATGYWSVPENTWPQPAIDPNALCGVVQADIYPFETDADKQRTNSIAADARLDEGEDYGWAITWTVKDYGPCATPTASTPVTTTPTTTTPPATKPPVEPTPTPTHSSDTPPTAPPTVPATAPATSPTTAPTSPSPSATSTAAKPTSERLAYTGTNTGPELAAGILATISGLVLLIWKRNKA